MVSECMFSDCPLLLNSITKRMEYVFMDNAEEFITREKLYEMVWTTPMQKLGAEFGMSDVAFTKRCKKLGVPTPPRGYWARLAAGQHPKVPGLPPRQNNQANGMYLRRRNVQKTIIQLSKATTDAVEMLCMPQNRVIVSDTLSKPHRLVRFTKQVFSGAQSDEYGALWGRWIGECLDIRVSKGSLRRALLIMDALLKKLEVLGFEVLSPDEGRIRTLVIQNDVQLEIKLYERSKRFEQVLNEKQKLESWRYNKYRFEPTGEFEFTLSRWPFNQRHWKDSPKSRLEDRLTEIVAEIIESTELVQLENERKENERIQMLELQRLAAEERQRQLEEKERRDELERQAECWRRSKVLNEYLRACESTLSESERPVEPGSDVTGWLRWGYLHADRLNPIQNGSMEKLISTVVRWES